MASCSEASKKWMYLVNHVFLPPKLPQGNDTHGVHEFFLANKVVKSLKDFSTTQNDAEPSVVRALRAAIDATTNVVAVHNFTAADRDITVIGNELLEKLKSLFANDNVGIFPIPVKVSEQNAGIFMYRLDGSIRFEMFELMADNAAVTDTLGRLIRCFPGAALEVPMEQLNDDFLVSISNTIQTMSGQVAPGTSHTQKKANQSHDETREPVRPMIVTELLASILLSLRGSAVQVQGIKKHTRDEVLWKDCLLPWRRSSLWLLMRVSIQLALVRSGLPAVTASSLYKQFMLFFTANILADASKVLKSDTNCLEWTDLVYAMKAKVSRRLHKLDARLSRPLESSISTAMKNATVLLETHWQSVRDKEREADSARVSAAGLAELDFERDTRAYLPAVDRFIQTISKRGGEAMGQLFQPQCPLVDTKEGRPWEMLSTGKQKAFCASTLDRCSVMMMEPGGASTTIKSTDETTRICFEAMQSHISPAASSATHNPEAWSLMVLGILELWIVCDRAAIKECPLLLAYDPGIYPDHFQVLLLPFRSQMERLAKVEEYVRGRRSGAFRPCPWTGFGNAESFAVEYVDLSSKHQDLLRSIQKEATECRERKCEEFRTKLAHYNSLMSQHGAAACEYYTEIIDDEEHIKHKGGCRKCALLRQAQGMEIQIFEWPLPSKEASAKAVVFELQIPYWYAIWRQATNFVIFDVLNHSYASEAKSERVYLLSADVHLQRHFWAPPQLLGGRRIGLGSQAKANVQSHYTSKRLSSVASEYCVIFENALQYQYFDESVSRFVGKINSASEITATANSATYKLPAVSSALQEYLMRPPASPDGPSPNTVLASQHSCPDHMSLNEYKALCSIPLGHRIQWQNLLAQVTAPCVDFRKIETALVVLQCMYQAGPCAAGPRWHRDSHSIPVFEDRFCETMLASLGEATAKIEDNWQCIHELSTYIMVARRLLTLAESDRIRHMALRFLAKARIIARDWIKVLKDRVNDTMSDTGKISLRAKVAHAALVHADSFNLDDKLANGQSVLHLILKEDSNAADFINSCITIQESYSESCCTDALQPMLHWRWQLLCARTCDILYNLIADKPRSCLDDAIEFSWAAYRPSGEGWRSAVDKTWCSHGQRTWLTTQSGSQNDTGDAMIVHYCLVTGELRVNGYPLNRLPASYEKNTMYKRLFGRTAIEVMPGCYPGLGFSGKKLHMGHEVHFGSSGPEQGSSRHHLLVRAIKGGKTWEFIEPGRFTGFPTEFVDNYVHWYDIESNIIEFRPIKEPWSTSQDNWRLTKTKESTGWQLVQNGRVLIAPEAINSESRTSNLLSRLLGPLVDVSDLHLIYRPTLQVVDMELPKLKLSFTLQKGTSTVASSQFRGMVIDANQGIDTLVGFQNKLVLCSRHSDPLTRKVLLVEGPVTSQMTRAHVCSYINKSLVVRAHAYDVDPQLCRLVDNGSLESKLFLCQIHALTSFCLPDPLTMHTGTETALDILRSAAVKSFVLFSQENLSKLGQIARLTPARVYYPSHLKSMQTVTWANSVGFMAQHPGFLGAVTALFQAAAERKFFYREQYLVPPKFDKHKDRLIARDEMRTSCFRISRYGAEKHDTTLDKTYTSRDKGQESAGAQRAFDIAQYVFSEREAPAFNISSNGTAEHIWKFLEKKAGQLVYGPSKGPQFGIGAGEAPMYDAKWLLASSKSVLAEKMIAYHCILPSSLTYKKRSDVLVWLATLAYSTDADMHIIQLLACFVNVAALYHLQAPRVKAFSPANGHVIRRGELISKLQDDSLHRPFGECPESKNVFKANHRAYSSARSAWGNNRRSAIESMATHAVAQWPCGKVQFSDTSTDYAKWATYLRFNTAREAINQRVKLWHQNHQLYEYLDEIVETIPSASPLPRVKDNLRAVARSTSSVLPSVPCKSGFVGEIDVFSSLPPLEEVSGLDTTYQWAQSCTVEKVKADEGTTPSSVGVLINTLANMAEAGFEKDYVAALRQSAESLQLAVGRRGLQGVESGAPAQDFWRNHLAEAETHRDATYNRIEQALNYYMAGASCLESGVSTAKDYLAAHRPRVSPRYLLQFLARDKWDRLPEGWKQCLVQYAKRIHDVQRLQRIVSAALRNDHAALASELGNPGHANWDPVDHPDSLLLEVESGLTIRNVQEEIAAQMRTPPDGDNAVMQLNMGEGKSSVIVPIVAAALADGTRLVRVIVAKPQSQQMLQMLTSKLGGMLNRVVFQMPFSRALRVSTSEAQGIQSLLKRCRDEGGVLLVQPEHILSLELMGKEYAMDEGKLDAGRSLTMTRHFLHRHARDIVDESDENFSVKFELVYTMGEQQNIDHGSKRWKTIQEVLDIIRAAAPSVLQRFPDSMEIYDSAAQPGSFPRTRVLRSDAMDQLLDHIVSYICDQGLTDFPLPRQVPTLREAVRTYLTKPDLSDEEIDRVEREGAGGFWTEAVKPTLVLLRGLLACNVLSFAFMQKRWRVNYGTALTRTPATRLAVPYLAKDRPSPRSEFSHPDVVIILTCLSYYYSGLSDDDLFLVFDHLLKADQPEVEYAAWARDNPQMPAKFKSLAGVNVEDRHQCMAHIFPHLRSTKSVIDYFLDRIVFEKEMREFPSKLSASGWDLGEKKEHPTTGFSGTNDSRRLLPLDMTQLDLAEQKHTNALVLGYLLQPETSVTDIPARSAHQATDADALLDLVVGLEPPVRVILDVGAQVLELSNLQVAQQWLGRVRDDRTQGVVFFDDNDELSVLDRSGDVERLQTSPFASKLDVCLVFLDEAHTRGTDLKLPKDYRAAVTLGANQTKDGLMQGCMRMRKLGHGQSVVFCVPREIRVKIRRLMSGEQQSQDSNAIEYTEEEIKVSDILIWSIRETWISLQRGVQLWASQGWRHRKHQNLWVQATKHQEPLTEDDALDFLEDEALTILQRYRPESPSKRYLNSLGGNPLAGKAVDPILGRLRDFGAATISAAALQEEQERELDPETERERELERPPPTAPAKHSLHVDVQQFVLTGALPSSSPGYMRAFRSLDSTQAGKEFGMAHFPETRAPTLLVSSDFATTVSIPTWKQQKIALDHYLRSVQWVVTNKVADGRRVVMIISPFEANELLPTMKSSQTARMHIYCPRANSVYPSLDNLKLFTYPEPVKAKVPRVLTVGLNVFAGQLYFNDYKMYVATCKFLGLSWQKAREGEELDADGFMAKDQRGRVGGKSGFAKSPIRLMRDLMEIRYGSQASPRTHMGAMLGNRLLSEKDFEGEERT